MDFTSATINEFEPKDEMYGSDIDSEPEATAEPNLAETSHNRSHRSNLASSSSDEIDAFKNALQPTPPKRPRKKRTKKVEIVKIIQDQQPTSDSDSEETEKIEKMSKKISADAVLADINNDVDEKMSGSDAETQNTPQKKFKNNREISENSDSDDDIVIKRPKNKTLVFSDSE